MSIHKYLVNQDAHSWRQLTLPVLTYTLGQVCCPCAEDTQCSLLACIHLVMYDHKALHACSCVNYQPRNALLRRGFKMGSRENSLEHVGQAWTVIDLLSR